MKINELINLLEANKHKSSFSDQDREELEQLIQGLVRIRDVEISELVKATEKVKLPKARPAAIQVNPSVDKAVERLKSLEIEVRQWTRPDYDSVRRVISEVCKAFRKPEVISIAKQIQGKANGKLSKEALLESLAQPYIRQLEIRFMNVGA